MLHHHNGAGGQIPDQFPRGGRVEVVVVAEGVSVEELRRCEPLPLAPKCTLAA